MNLKLIVPVASVAAVLLVGCGQEKEVKLETTEQKVSYGVGMNIGRQLQSDSAELDAETVIAGIRDVMSGAEPKLSEEDVQQAFQALRDETMAEQKELEAAAAQASIDFLAENANKEGIMVTESGLQYEVMTSVEEGASPAATDTVKVHYHGTLINGEVFDSSVERGEPTEFPVNRVIAGWTEALQLMKVGEKWKLYIPAELAYGERSPSPRIPAHSALIFEVELLDVLTAE